MLELPFPERREFPTAEAYNWHLGVEGCVLRPETVIGDILAPLLIKILETGGQYPGDQAHWNNNDRFIIETYMPGGHLIRDKRWNVTTFFDNEHMTYPDFKPALEYAHHCAIATGEPLPEVWHTEDHEAVGPLLERQVEHLVEEGRPYLHDQSYAELWQRRCNVYWDSNDIQQLLVGLPTVAVCRRDMGAVPSAVVSMQTPGRVY